MHGFSRTAAGRPARFFALPAALAFLALLACSPTYDWRQVPLDTAPAQALLPCKPDAGARQIDVGARLLSISMKGCEAAGTTFAIGWTELPDAKEAEAVAALWRRATLANARATHLREAPLQIRGVPDGTRVAATAGPAEAPVALQGTWFSRDRFAFQVLAITTANGRPLSAEVAETFFGGLELR